MTTHNSTSNKFVVGQKFIISCEDKKYPFSYTVSRVGKRITLLIETQDDEYLNGGIRATKHCRKIETVNENEYCYIDAPYPERVKLYCIDLYKMDLDEEWEIFCLVHELSYYLSIVKLFS